MGETRETILRDIAPYLDYIDGPSSLGVVSSLLNSSSSFIITQSRKMVKELKGRAVADNSSRVYSLPDHISSEDIIAYISNKILSLSQYTEAKKQADEIKNEISKEAPPSQMYLPNAPMPTDLCRVSPFFPLNKRGARSSESIRSMVITKSSWGEITYTGLKLSTYDEDVLLSLLSLLDQAEHQNHDTIDSQPTLTYKGSMFNVLKNMGYDRVGGDNYSRVMESFKSMASAVFTLSVNKRTTRGARKLKKHLVTNMLSRVSWDEESNSLVVTINPFFYAVYMEGNYTLIDVKERASIKSPIAKALYRFMTSQRDSKWEGNILTLTRSLNMDESQPMFKTRQNIKNAISELIKIGFLRKESCLSKKIKDLVILEKSQRKSKRLISAK